MNGIVGYPNIDPDGESATQVFIFALFSPVIILLLMIWFFYEIFWCKRKRAL